MNIEQLYYDLHELAGMDISDELRSYLIVDIDRHSHILNGTYIAATFTPRIEYQWSQLSASEHAQLTALYLKYGSDNHD